jgi:ABC-type branched-subunit amino acid transport system ATPase component
MNNFDSWLCYDPSSNDDQTIIDDRTNELIKTDYNPAKLIAEAVSELTVKENLEMAEYVKENDMSGLGNYIYLKAYDFAHKLASKQAEHEFENGELE